VDFLQSEFESFDYLINPYHIQPGLLLDINITSIKRKKYTLMQMANVLNEFLHGVSKGFQDAAFATFKRRRSTVREDISQHFTSDIDEPIVKTLPKETAKFSTGEEPTEEVKGKADVTPPKRRGGSEDLQEL